MAPCAGTRGIRNLSGVSCHISAALQLIHHGLPELRQSLIRLADAYASGGCGRNEDDGFDSDPPKTVLFVYQLGILFKNLSSPDVEENGSTDDIAAPKAVDPMPLYEVLPPALNYQDVGDAATALRAILTTIRSELEEKRKRCAEAECRVESSSSSRAKERRYALTPSAHTLLALCLLPEASMVSLDLAQTYIRLFISLPCPSF